MIINATMGGLTLRSAEQLLGPNEQLELINADLQDPGSARPRTGYATPTMSDLDDEPITGAHACFYRRDELCVMAAGRLYSYSPGSAAAIGTGFVDRGAWTQGTARVETLLSDTQDQLDVDCAEIDGFTAFCWTVQNSAWTLLVPIRDVYFAVIDSESRQIIVGPTLIGSDGVAPRIIAADTWVGVVWTEDWAGPGRPLKLAQWFPATAATTPTISTIDTGASFWKDIVADASDTILVASDNVTAAEIRVYRISNAGATTDTGSVALGVQVPEGLCIALLASSGESPALHVAVGASTYTGSFPDAVTYAHFFQQDLTFVRSKFVADSGDGTGHITGISTAQDTLSLFVERGDTVPDFGFPGYIQRYTVIGTAAGAMTAGIETRGEALAGNPVVLDGTIVLPVLQGDLADDDRSSYSSALLLIREVTREVIGRILEGGQADNALYTYSAVPNCLVSDTTVKLPITIRDQPGEDIEDAYTRPPLAFVEHDIGMATFEFAETAVAAAELAKCAHAAGAGFLRGYDGRSVFELDWHQLPTILGESEAAGSSAMVPGTRTWAVMWEWSDNHGNIYRSGPVQMDFETTLADAEVTLIVSTLKHTARENVRLLVARTIAGGDEFYRVDDPTNPEFVDGSVYSMTFVDDISDVMLIEREPIVEAGVNAKLPADPTPATDFCYAARGRLFFGNPYVPNLLGATRPLQSGFGAHPTPENVYEQDTEQQLTGVASQDGAYYAFSNDTVCVFAGEGTDAFGNGQPFSPSARQPIEIGATGQNVICITPYGIMYGSTQGARLLARDRNSLSPFERINHAYQYLGQGITAMIYDPASTDLILFDDGDDVDPEGLSSKRMTIRINQATNRATHDLNHQALDADVSVSGQIAFMRTDGRACIKDGSRADGSGLSAEPIVMYGITSWLRGSASTAPNRELDELSGIVISGAFLDTHNVGIKLLKNYNHYAFDALQVTMDPERDGLRSAPVSSNLQDGSGDSYLFKYQRPLNAFAVAIAWQVTPGESGAAPVPAQNTAAISQIDVAMRQVTPELAPLDQRRTY